MRGHQRASDLLKATHELHPQSRPDAAQTFSLVWFREIQILFIYWVGSIFLAADNDTQLSVWSRL
jgi:hypothetical protein